MKNIKNIFNQPLKQAFYVFTLVGASIVIIVCVLAVNHFVLSWTEPTSPPPTGFSPQKSYSLSAHDGDPDPALYVDDNGNVGIGTNNPGEKLDVNGQIIGGFGAQTTGGVANWNDITNIRSGSGHTLLRGNAANGPGSSNYFHPFNFEYNTKDGSGNITQFAIPYGNSASINQGIYIRGRYGGSWTGWQKVGGGTYTYHTIACNNNSNTFLGSHDVCFLTDCSGNGGDVEWFYCDVWPQGKTFNGASWTGKRNWYGRAYSHDSCASAGLHSWRAAAVCIDY